MKILIIHTFGIGDMIMFTPALKLLKEKFPESKIDFFIMQKASKEVIKNDSCVNEIIESNLNYFMLLKKIMYLRKKKYDITVTTTGVKPLKAMVFSKLISGKIKLGDVNKKNMLFNLYDREVWRNPLKHMVENNIDIIKALLNIETLEKIEPYFSLSKEDYNFGENFVLKHKLEKKVIIGIHPGCNNKFLEKRWENEEYLDLIKKLISVNIVPIVFIGPDDIEVETYLLNKKCNAYFIKEKELSKVAALISKCDYFFNSDSGLGHIASCFKLKRIFTVFQVTNPQKIRPYNSNLEIINNFSREMNSEKVFKIIMDKIGED